MKKAKTHSRQWTRHLERMATDPGYAERYRAYKKLNDKKRYRRHRLRMRKDPAYAEEFRRNLKKYRSKPAQRKRAAQYMKNRYANDAGFRKRMSRINKRWRENNHDYDMLRKAIYALSEYASNRTRKYKISKKWKRGLSERRRSILRKHHRDYAAGWFRSQRDDKEIGWAFKIMKKKPSPTITASMIKKARDFYNKKMAERKAQRREDRIRSLAKGCTQIQKQKLREQYGIKI